MRKKLIAGNWKMNLLLASGTALAKEVAEMSKKIDNKTCQFLICPPFTLLTNVKKALRGSKVCLGAQDAHFNIKGAHTGDVSPQMLTDVGCKYVILGHSERRADHFETNEIVNKKAMLAHENGLISIICVGETLEQREKGKALDICSAQVLGSLPEDSNAKNTVIAYEPVWAIGTGKTPTPQDVAEVHSAIRTTVAKKFGKATASKMQILYGGSVKPSNAKSFLGLEDVDGALIGGASLKADDFIAIAEQIC